MKRRAQRPQRSVAGKTAQPVDGGPGKIQPHGAFRAGEEPVLLHVRKEDLVQPRRAGHGAREIGGPGADAAHDLGEVSHRAGVGQALHQGRTFALRAGAGGVQAPQQRFQRQIELLAIAFEQQERGDGAAVYRRGAKVVLARDERLEHAAARFAKEPRMHALRVRSQFRAAQVPRPAEQGRGVRRLQVDVGARLVFEDLARALRPARFLADGAQYVQDPPLIVDAAHQQRFEVAPPLALQGGVHLRLRAPLGKRRHAQRMRKRPPRLVFHGGLQSLRHAGSGRAPYIQRAQYGVEMLAEHGRLPSSLSPPAYSERVRRR